MNYGRMFRIAREKMRLSQKEAAEQIGVKSYQLANYETNRSEPSLDVLIKMSKVYHTSIDHMLYNTKFQQRMGDTEDYREENKKLLLELKRLLANYEFLDQKDDE